jgi:hypothetical protein
MITLTTLGALLVIAIAGWIRAGLVLKALHRLEETVENNEEAWNKTWSIGGSEIRKLTETVNKLVVKDILE